MEFVDRDHASRGLVTGILAKLLGMAPPGSA